VQAERRQHMHQLRHRSDHRRPISPN
jgi:hypothetical protein